MTAMYSMRGVALACALSAFGAVANGNPIRARGRILPSGVAPVDLAVQTIGDRQVVTRAGPILLYEGDLQGVLSCTSKVVRNATTGAQQTLSAFCNFIGTLAGSQGGAMTKIYTITNDADFNGLPESTSTFWMAGVGGLKGACGEGSAWSAAPPATWFEYDYTFRFGAACHGN